MFYGSFDSWSDVLGQFEVKDIERFEKVTPLFASYSQEGYEGSAVVLFIEHGKIYSAHGSHCSCFGLEGQWEPEETTFEAIKHIAVSGDYQFSGFEDQIAKMMTIFTDRGIDVDTDPKELEFLIRLYF